MPSSSSFFFPLKYQEGFRSKSIVIFSLVQHLKRKREKEREIREREIEREIRERERERDGGA
jgi:hypothetical protein